MKKTVIILALCVLSAAFGLDASAQRYSVATNLVEWANLGTINAEAGVAVSRHFSVHAAARYNPWTFRPGNPDDRLTDPLGDTEIQFENRKQAYSLGVRYWPWYIYTGWWFYARGQYMEYNRGGLINHWAEEGDAYGLGLGFGYTYLLRKNWNIEFGAGVWGGYRDNTRYRCTNCGTVLDQGTGKGGFFLPDDVFISLIYIF